MCACAVDDPLELIVTKDDARPSVIELSATVKQECLLAAEHMECDMKFVVEGGHDVLDRHPGGLDQAFLGCGERREDTEQMVVWCAEGAANLRLSHEAARTATRHAIVRDCD